MDYLASVGKRIRQLRLAAGMSQDTLAKKAGYTSRSSINKIELGYTDIPLLKIISLAEALSVSPIEILLPVDERNVTEREALLLESYRKSPDVRALLDQLFALSDDSLSTYSAAYSSDNQSDGNGVVSESLWNHIASTPETTETLISGKDPLT